MSLQTDFSQVPKDTALMLMQTTACAKYNQAAIEDAIQNMTKTALAQRQAPCSLPEMV